MPSHHTKKPQNPHLARAKALHTHVYISGIRGHHTLELGIAYYYRGHYIYAYPAGNLIEPVPYSTRRGIVIQGVVRGSAPGYGEGGVLVEEESVRALGASIESEGGGREGERDAEGEGEGEGESKAHCTSHPPRPSFPRASSAGAQESARIASLPPRHQLTAHVPHSPVSTTAPPDAARHFTPRPDLPFLAASAPQSRLASRAASPSGLRPTTSHISLHRLGALRSHFQPLNATPCRDECAENGSRPQVVGYLYGLGDHALGEDARVPPCALHGEECDGVGTSRVWNTEEVRRGCGFVEEVPMLDKGGRVMVDWVGLLEEVGAEGGRRWEV